MIREQDNICPICNEKLFIGDIIHKDHIISIAIGGKDEIENIQIVHESCNFKKGCR